MKKGYKAEMIFYSEECCERLRVWEEFDGSCMGYKKALAWANDDWVRKIEALESAYKNGIDFYAYASTFALESVTVKTVTL